MKNEVTELLVSFSFFQKKKKNLFKFLKYIDEIECEMDTGTEVKLMYGYYYIS